MKTARLLSTSLSLLLTVYKVITSDYDIRLIVIMMSLSYPSEIHGSGYIPYCPEKFFDKSHSIGLHKVLGLFS